MKGLSTLDVLVFVLYFILVAGYGYWIYLKRKKPSRTRKTSSWQKDP